jgi:exopolysaccharide biosynthesis predicted pyruvyltransferase EpsI
VTLQVVQLPQSLTFSSSDKIQSDEQIINAMPQGMLTLFTRQEESLAYAQAHYPNTTVLPAPDLAFSLGPLIGGKAQVRPAVWTCACGASENPKVFHRLY